VKILNINKDKVNRKSFKGGSEKNGKNCGCGFT